MTRLEKAARRTPRPYMLLIYYNDTLRGNLTQYPCKYILILYNNSLRDFFGRWIGLIVKLTDRLNDQTVSEGGSIGQRCSAQLGRAGAGLVRPEDEES
jgi:hypothetical protein